MSIRPDGGVDCDRCGTVLPNDGIDVCVKITDLDPDDLGSIRQLHLCVDRPDPAHDGKTIQGCRDHVLTKRALRHYHETKD